MWSPGAACAGHVAVVNASTFLTRQVLRLEDGMWADFGSPLLRAELAAAALALGPIFETHVGAALRSGSEEQLDEARAATVRAMRGCLDLTVFARDGGAARGRERERYAKDDAAKVAAHGEGHCRSCSSCFAPFLWSFAELLGIEPRYCTDAGASHQWLQYTARPSMRTFACDLYRDECAAQCGAPRGTHLAEPAEAAYGAAGEAGADSSWAGGPGETCLFPTEAPLEFGGRRVGLAPLEAGDVCF